MNGRCVYPVSSPIPRINRPSTHIPHTNRHLPVVTTVLVTDTCCRRCLGQAATSFVNDSLLTTVCIQYRPGQVAAAVVYLSYLYMGLPRVDTVLLETDGSVIAGETDFLSSASRCMRHCYYCCCARYF